MDVEQTVPSPPSVRLGRVWFALVLPMLVMAVVFMGAGSFLAATRGLRGDQIGEAIGPYAFPLAGAVFLIVFGAVTLLARKDGLSLRDLGWRRPSAMDLLIGVGATLVLVAFNHFLAHPVVKGFKPDFDPTIPLLSTWQAATLQVLGVAAEDTVYRGYALTRLPQRLSVPVAVLLSTLAYALLSAGQGPAVVVWTVFLGLAFSLLFLWRRNLWPVAVAHYLLALAPRVLT